MPAYAQQNLLLDRLPVGAEHVTAKELAGAMGVHVATIIAAIEEGKLTALGVNGAGKRGQESRRHWRIPVESARIFILQSSNGLTDADTLEALERITDRLPRPLLAQLHTITARKLQR